MKSLILYATLATVTAACAVTRVSSVADANRLAEEGFSGPIQLSGYYFYHPEEDTLSASTKLHDGAFILLVLNPEIYSTSTEKGYLARAKWGARLNGKQVRITGVLRKGVMEGWHRAMPFVEVSAIDEANQSPEATPEQRTTVAPSPPSGAPQR